jgi:hypothetical protein
MLTYTNAMMSYALMMLSTDQKHRVQPPSIMNFCFLLGYNHAQQ